MTVAASPTIGQTAHTHGARIAGVVSCVPREATDNSAFAERFGADAVADVVKMIGVHSRRRVQGGVSTADLCEPAGRALLAGLGWEPHSIDGLIFVSQTPDYVLPATACALHGRWGLRPGALAFDVNLGCSGYPYALWLAMTIVQSGAARRMLVAVGDTISRVVDPDDRATAMLFGDAGTVTAVELADDAEPSLSTAHFVLGTDGRGEYNLIIPQGQFKSRSAQDDGRLANRDPRCLFMDGGEIFNFTLLSVPALVKATMEAAGASTDDHDAFLFHQANQFMLKHLVKKTKLPVDRVPMNIDRFGNTSSASIPLLMTTDMASTLRSQRSRIAMFGFGVGYSWASASLDVGPLKVVETIET